MAKNVNFALNFETRDLISFTQETQNCRDLDNSRLRDETSGNTIWTPKE